MTTAEIELNSFANFVRQHIAASQVDLTIDELFDQWRFENPTPAQFEESVAAIRASIQDFKNGIRGSLAGEHSAKLRSDLGTQAE